MRLSVLDWDRGYSAWLQHRDSKVFLDGVEVQRCITADEEAGEVSVLLTDQVDGDGCKVEVRRGQVGITLITATNKL